MNVFLEAEELAEDTQSLEREKLMKAILSLQDGNEGKQGVDSLCVLPDGRVVKVQLKSSTKMTGWGTARDLSWKKLQVWTKQHYVYGNGKYYKSGFKFAELFYVPPHRIVDLFEACIERLKKRQKMSETVRKVLKNSEHNHPQFWKEYDAWETPALTLNNDKIPRYKVVQYGYAIEEPYAENLRKLIMKYGDNDGRSIQRDITFDSTDEDTLPL